MKRAGKIGMFGLIAGFGFLVGRCSAPDSPPKDPRAIRQMHAVHRHGDIHISVSFDHSRFGYGQSAEGAFLIEASWFRPPPLHGTQPIGSYLDDRRHKYGSSFSIVFQDEASSVLILETQLQQAWRYDDKTRQISRVQ